MKLTLTHDDGEVIQQWYVPEEEVIASAPCDTTTSDPRIVAGLLIEAGRLPTYEDEDDYKSILDEIKAEQAKAAEGGA